ncbi:MAG: YabP/YqfC family sporulation protein [Christensenellales bacterium]
MENENIKKQNIEIINRQTIILSGVEKVKNINENIFIGKIAGCGITVQGNGMELTKLDLESGVVEISGTINSLKYTTNAPNQSLLKRIFK